MLLWTPNNDTFYRRQNQRKQNEQRRRGGEQGFRYPFASNIAGDGDSDSDFYDGEKAGKVLKRRAARAQKIQSFSLAAVAGIIVLISILLFLQGFRSSFRRSGTGPLRFKSSNTTNWDNILPKDSIYNLEYTNLKGEKVSLRQYAGQVALVVNTACA